MHGSAGAGRARDGAWSDLREPDECYRGSPRLLAVLTFPIGDPRMDMGVVTEAQRQQPLFEPARLLSAEDVLTVMDRLFASEVRDCLRARADRQMCFIDGHALASTVYTCLYTQATDRFAMSSLPANGAYPPQLVGLVLRSYVLATLKICDMLWIELVRGNLREVCLRRSTALTRQGEDTWTDKAGVSLLEDMPPDEVLGLLDEANEWLQSARRNYEGR